MEEDVQLDFGNETKKENFDHLPLEQRLVHSSYDARKSGVEELIKLFNQETEADSNTFSSYQGNKICNLYPR